jgi:hypothetical protein
MTGDHEDFVSLYNTKILRLIMRELLRCFKEEIYADNHRWDNYDLAKIRTK